MTVEELIRAIRSLENQSGPVMFKIGNMYYPIHSVESKQILQPVAQHLVVLDSKIIESFE